MYRYAIRVTLCDPEIQIQFDESRTRFDTRDVRKLQTPRGHALVQETMISQRRFIGITGTRSKAGIGVSSTRLKFAFSLEMCASKRSYTYVPRFC